MRLLRAAFPDRPVLDMAISHALLQRVASGALPATLRLYRPGPTLAFGRLDVLRPGFAGAVAAARARGLEPVVRLAGGHAAAYDEQSLIYEEIAPQRDVTAGLHERFRDGAEHLADALRGLGVDAVVGEVPGEYCAGAYTVSAAGRIKLVGVAQRAVRGAALLSAFVIVAGGARLRGALVDVYRELDIAWEPATAGGLDDVAPGIEPEEVQEAILAGRATELVDLDDETLALARELEARHRVA